MLNLERDADGLHDFAQGGFSGFRFFLQRSVPRTSDNAMRENGNRQLLEVVWHAVVAPFQESAGLGGALQHQSSARTDTESELTGIPSAIDDFQSVIMQAGIYFYASDRSEEHTSELQP